MNYTVTENTSIREIIEAVQNTDTSDLYLTYQEGSFLKKFPHHITVIKKILAHMGQEVSIHVVGDNDTVPGNSDFHEGVAPVIAGNVGGSEFSQTPAKTVVTEGLNDSLTPVTVNDNVQNVNPPIENKEPTTRRSFGIKPKKLIIAVVILVLLGLTAGGAFAYYYLPRGTVVLFVAEKTFERKLDVLVKTTVSEVNLKENIIPGNPITVEVQSTENFDATGHEIIGEKATGTIDVKNFTTTAIRLASGAVITSQSDSTKQFTLTEGVTVPKATITQPTEDTKVLDAGIISVSVEAVDIGDQYNLSASTRFILGGYEVSDVYAVNAVPFSGGLTKEITVVSADDQTKAIEQLHSKLVADVPGALDEKLSDTQRYQVDSIENATKSAQFSHEVGEEASSFSLSMKLSSTVISYDHKDVTSLMQTLIVDAVPKGFELSGDDDPVGVDKVETVDDETLKLSARISALVVPILDTDKIQQELLGVKPNDAEIILQNVADIKGYEVRLWPTLPDFLKSFPHVKEKLEVLVEVSQ